MGIKDGFMQLDVLRKLPKDLTEPTFCGAFVSLICTLTMIILGVAEITNYLNPAVSS
jgi:endoplasmic reticulum-Golgi intermediate compartment protein 1